MSETEASFKSRFFRLDNPNLIFSMVSSLCQRTIIRLCDHFPRSWGSHNIIYPLNQDGLGLCLSALPRDVVSVTCDAVGPYPSLSPSFKQQPTAAVGARKRPLSYSFSPPAYNNILYLCVWEEVVRRICVNRLIWTVGVISVEVSEDHIFFGSLRYVSVSYIM